jgi:hypothetical protein
MQIHRDVPGMNFSRRSPAAFQLSNKNIGDAAFNREKVIFLAGRYVDLNHATTSRLRSHRLDKEQAAYREAVLPKSFESLNISKVPKDVVPESRHLPDCRQQRSGSITAQVA